MNKKNAFTLLEVLVVATIIGLLAAVGAVSYSQFVKQSRDARRKADLEQIRAALEMYRSNNDAYPTTITIGSCNPTAAGITDTTAIYLSKIPTDPMCTTHTYCSSVSADDYTIGAYLETNSSASTCLDTCNYCLGPYGQK